MLFTDINYQIPWCACLAELPEDASRLLGALSRIDELPTEQLLTKAQNILKVTKPVAAASTSRVVSRHDGSNTDPLPVCNRHEGPICYKCSGPNHFSRECWSLSGKGMAYQWSQCTLWGIISVMSLATYHVTFGETYAGARYHRHLCPPPPAADNECINARSWCPGRGACSVQHSSTWDVPGQ